MNNYASTLVDLLEQINDATTLQPEGAGYVWPDSFFCSLHLGFLNEL
jgi:hypothetical protein